MVSSFLWHFFVLYKVLFLEHFVFSCWSVFCSIRKTGVKKVTVCVESYSSSHLWGSNHCPRVVRWVVEAAVAAWKTGSTRVPCTPPASPAQPPASPKERRSASWSWPLHPGIWRKASKGAGKRSTCRYTLTTVNKTAYWNSTTTTSTRQTKHKLKHPLIHT